MENFLGDILTTVKLKSAVYFKYGFCSPWGMDVPKGIFSQFHLVANGDCILKSAGGFIKLAKGDVVIFPKGAAHKIKGKPRSACKPGQEVVTEIVNGKNPFAGGEISTQLICGHYEMDKNVSHPIFDELPEQVIIKSDEYGRFDLIHSVFELIVEEMTDKKPGYTTVSLRLAEILFISIIRHYYLKQLKGELNLFSDELIYESINLIHQEIDKYWSLEQLAQKAGVSRTLYIQRFKKAVGDTPMNYITKWRMSKAIYLLKNTDLPVTQIGEKIGYQSETSFNRVFKKQFKVSPGRFRVAEKN